MAARFEQPAAGDRFVYVANPARSNVAVIDAQTFAIELAQAGEKPTFLTTLGGRDVAVVLNVGSGDVSVLRTERAGTRSNRLDMVDGANAIAVAPDGRHAVVYFDANGPRTTTASGASLQDVTVLFFGEDEADDRAVHVSVGFRPSEVRFNDDGSRAFVVTEDGISVLDFADIEARGALIAPLVRLADVGVPAVDVSITPDGRYAVARVEGTREIRRVALSDGDIVRLDLGSVSGGSPDDPADAGIDGDDASLGDAGQDDAGLGDVGDGGVVGEPPPAVGALTDIDLAPSGEFAVAVSRESGTLFRIPVPDGFTEPTQIRRLDVAGVSTGLVTITPDGNQGLVFTTATNDKRVGLVDLESLTLRQVVRLRKGVRAVAVTEDSRVAFIIHTKQPGSPDENGVDEETRIERSYGYSLIALEDAYAKLQVTAADIGPFVATPDSDRLCVLLGDEATSPPVRQAHLVDLASFQALPLHLGGPPRSVGVVPGPGRIFVGQENPEGRITFIDWSNGEERTAAGFELNSRVRN